MRTKVFKQPLAQRLSTKGNLTHIQKARERDRKEMVRQRAPCETKYSLRDLVLRHYRWLLCAEWMRCLLEMGRKVYATKDWLYRVYGTIAKAEWANEPSETYLRILVRPFQLFPLFSGTHVIIIYNRVSVVYHLEFYINSHFLFHGRSTHTYTLPSTKVDVKKLCIISPFVVHATFLTITN